MTFTISPKLVKYAAYQIANFVENESLKPWFTTGSQLLGSPTGIRDSNYARYLIPTLKSVKLYREMYDEIASGGTIKTTVTNTVTEIGITLKEYITDTQLIRQRDYEQTGIEQMVSRYIAGIKHSITAAVNMSILETVYRQSVSGRIAESLTAGTDTPKGAVVDTTSVSLLPSDTDVQRLTKANLFAQMVRDKVDEISNLKTVEGQVFPIENLTLLVSPMGKQLLGLQQLQLFSSALTETFFKKGLLADGTFYGISVKMTNQLDVPVTQRNGGAGANSVLGLLVYAGATACPFVFDGEMHFDREPGSYVYKLNMTFNTGSGVIFPYLFTIFANTGAVANATATVPAKSGLTAQDRVVPPNINLNKIVPENLASVRDVSDTTNPAGDTANPAKANDGKGKA